MKKRMAALAVMTFVLLLLTACNEGQDDWNSSARIVGYVYTDPSHTHGINGVQVIFESDASSETPYIGPDRWVTTDANGYYDGAVFLGNTNGQYNYLADMRVAYFYDNKSFAWTGGISVGPGSVFTLPPVDTTMFQSMTAPGGGGQ